MPKMLRCTDIIPGCDFVARGESQDEVLARALEHARTKHHLRSITREILAQVEAAIREDNGGASRGASAA